MKKSTLFLILTWVTVVILLGATYPIAVEHNGFDIPRFIREINVNSAVKFLGVDLGVMGISFIVWMYIEGKRIGLKRWWLPLLGIFLVGMGVIVPWFFYLREKHMENKK
jgi:Terpene cyclase DEP1